MRMSCFHDAAGLRSECAQISGNATHDLSVDNSYFTTLEVTTCGALMNWARDTLFKGTKQECERRGIDFFRHMDERVTNRHTNILILPQFGSSGHPDLKHNMSASIAGLTLDTTEDDLYIALKESMLYQLKLACEYAAPLKLAFDKLVLTGGAANSLVSAHLRADIFQKPVYMLANNEAGTLGCMILAAVAIGAYPDIVTCIREVVKYSGKFFLIRIVFRPMKNNMKNSSCFITECIFPVLICIAVSKYFKTENTGL